MLNILLTWRVPRNKFPLFISFLLVCVFMFCAQIANAQTSNRISIVVPNKASQYMQVVESIRSNLKKNNKSETLRVINLSNFQQQLNPNLDNEKLVVLVGSKSFSFYVKAGAKSPYLPTLMTNSAFNYINKESNNKKQFVGGVSIDQPATRFVKLTQVLLPNLTSAALVFGPEKIKSKKRLLKNVRKNSINLNVVEISSNDNPVNKLRNAYESNQALIIFPDRKKFNRSLSRWVLTLSYQYKVPVISYSKKYATAGALVSLFSTSKQIGKQTAEMMIPFLNNSNAKIRRLIAPKYFDIQINQSIAKALNVTIPLKNELLKKISN